jgi:hypothetical protein
MAYPLLFSLSPSAGSGETAGRVTVSRDEKTTGGVDTPISKESFIFGNAPGKFQSTKEVSERSSLKSS